MFLQENHPMPDVRCTSKPQRATASIPGVLLVTVPNTPAGAAISVVEPRLDAKPWGGQALRRFGLPIGDAETIGEALVTANDARVMAGLGTGKTLGEIIREQPDTFLGPSGLRVTGERAIFPLLVKLIDANENLSIQVHPDDARAAAFDKTGKTEAWYVLDATSNARLYLGLRDPQSFDDFIAAADRLDGSSASTLRAIHPVAGETYLLPAGTIHALGAGVMVYEIQQPSDITYRLDDWGRVDAQGNPREMHREAGLAVSDPALQPEAIQPVRLNDEEITRDLLVTSNWFALERWKTASPEVAGGIPGESGPQVLTVLEGSLVAGGVVLGAGHSLVLWPSREPTSVVLERATVLRAFIPED